MRSRGGGMQILASGSAKVLRMINSWLAQEAGRERGGQIKIKGNGIEMPR